MHTSAHLALFGLQGWEPILLAFLGLLIFGKRLPEVGKSLGRGIVEFKKGLSGIEDEVERAGTQEPPKQIARQSGDTSASLPGSASRAAAAPGSSTGSVESGAAAADQGETRG